MTIVDKPFKKGMISIVQYFMGNGIRYFPARSDEDYFEARVILTEEKAESFCLSL